jgi:WD40 repeat protein
LKLSTALLGTDPAQLPGQLSGRLSDSSEPEIDRVLKEVDECAPRPWLRPVTPALTQAGGPLERVMLGHLSPVEAVAVSPDGSRIVSVDDNKSLLIWNLETGRLERTIEGHTNAVLSVAVTPDGSRLVSSGLDGTARIWEFASGRLEHTLTGHGNQVNAVAVTPDGTSVLSGDFEGAVRIWNLETGDLERTRTISGRWSFVSALAVTPTGSQFVSAGSDLRVWRLASGRSRTLEGHTEGVNAVAVTPDGARVVSGGQDGTVRVWDLATGRLERTLAGHTRGVRSVAVTPDGARIVSGGYDDAVRVWDLATGRLESTLRGHTDTVNAVAVTPDGTRVVSVGRDLTVRLWNLERLRPTTEGDDRPVSAVTITQDGARIIAADGSSARVRDLASGREERGLFKIDVSVFATAVSPDGARVASCGAINLVHVWDLASNRVERTLEGPKGQVRTVAFTPDGARIVTGHGADSALDDTVDTATICVWDAASGRLKRTLQGHSRRVWSLAVTPDGTRIVSGGGDGTLRIWDLAHGRLERTLDVDITSDMRAKGEEWRAQVLTVAVTPDGSRIVSGGYDRLVRIWDLASGRLEQTLQGHTDEVNAVALTADGARIVSCAFDIQGHSRSPDPLRVWDLASGQQIATWTPDPGVSVTACCTVPTDASLVAYGDSTGGIHVLRLLEDRPPAPIVRVAVAPAHHKRFGLLRR